MKSPPLQRRRFRFSKSVVAFASHRESTDRHHRRSPTRNSSLPHSLNRQQHPPVHGRSNKTLKRKPEKQDAPLTPKALPEPQPVPAPPATEKKPSTPLRLPSQLSNQQNRPSRNSAVKPQPQTSDRSISDSAEKSTSDASAPSRTGGASKTSGVDEYPRILPVNAQPEYPPAALQAGNEGRVLLAVLVMKRERRLRSGF